MSATSMQRRFAGQAQLVRLLLWRIGGTTEIDACLCEAADSGMITPDDAAFLRECLDAEEGMRKVVSAACTSTTESEREVSAALQSADSDDKSGTRADNLVIDEALVGRLQRCADKLNRADSA